MTREFPGNKRPLIYLISDNSLTDTNFGEDSKRFLDLVSAAVEAKIALIQIREKQLSGKNLFYLAGCAAQITQNTQTLLLVNDRADVALAAAADGVQLTANSLTAKTIRKNFPEDFIIGVSAHSLSEIKSAAATGANFATFGPIFPTPSKAHYNLPPQGVEKLEEICAAVGNFPIIALGGIDETNFAAVLQAGASGVAAIRFLNDSQNLSRIVSNIRND